LNNNTYIYAADNKITLDTVLQETKRYKKLSGAAVMIPDIDVTKRVLPRCERWYETDGVGKFDSNFYMPVYNKEVGE
jgi:hypothetical protein